MRRTATATRGSTSTPPAGLAADASERLDAEESDLERGTFTLDEVWALIGSGKMRDAPSLSELLLFLKEHALTR